MGDKVKNVGIAGLVRLTAIDEDDHHDHPHDAC
jgi:hypothetical protein